MITIREIYILLLALVVLAFSNSFLNFEKFASSLIFFAVILFVYTAAKKLAAGYYEAKEDIDIWNFQRYGLHEKSYFKKPVYAGIILPVFLAIISLGYIKWFAVTESEITATTARTVRRHDFYSFSEMTEWHLGLISSAGIASMFFLSAAAYFLNYPDLARLSIFFASFNLLPLGKLDGTKIFFGSRKAALWIFLAIIDLLGLAYIFLMP